MVRTGRCRQAGTTFIECVAALALLALVLTTSFAALGGRRRFLRGIDERLHVQHAIEKELETLRASPPERLGLRHGAPLVSDGSELREVPAARASLTVAPTEVPGLRRVRVEVTWGKGGARSAAVETLLFAGAPR